MQYTSAEASKLLKKFTEEKARLITEYKNGRFFIAAIEENIEDVRPDFSLDEMETKIAEIEENIRKVKHALNVFNTTHTVVDGDREITIDELLVLMPMLSEQKKRLEELATAMPKRRLQEYGSKSPHIEYVYANYSKELATNLLSKVTERILRLQLALDEANRVNKIEIDV